MAIPSGPASRPGEPAWRTSRRRLLVTAPAPWLVGHATAPGTAVMLNRRFSRLGTRHLAAFPPCPGCLWNDDDRRKRDRLRCHRISGGRPLGGGRAPRGADRRP